MTVAVTIVAGLVGFICLVGIGGNDVANSQAMAVGSGAISLRGAQIIAVVFEFLGAALVGHHVSSTVGSKIVDMDEVSAEKYSWGMFCAILTTAIWMFLATAFKMPVSSTHSIIGSLMGFQFVISKANAKSEHWDQLGNIGISWIVTPFLAFIISLLLMYIYDKWWPLLIIDDETLSKPLLKSVEMTGASIDVVTENDDETSQTLKDDTAGNINESYKQKKTFDLSDHFDSPTKPTPLKFSIVFAILWSTLILFVLAAGPKSITILDKVEWWVFVIIGIGSLLITMGIGYIIEPYYRKWYINKYYNHENETIDYEIFNNIDYYALYLVIASATVSFAHGGNDVANVLGPFGQIFQYEKNGTVSKGASIPLWLSGMGGIAIGIGFILFGKGVLETVGKGITEVNYQSGFIAQYSAALTVLACDIIALPVSSSTVIIGAVSGVAFYNTKKKTTIRKKMGREKKFTLQDEYDAMNVFGKCCFRIKRMNIKILLKIVSTWVITIPCNAIICGGIYAIMIAIFD